ncbi:hypothetical protein O181_039530 [Austropuccinia psidii MF-1]|uniref:Uncharacterized protein n=1 Tax=Austropuccinia psidii MF-1 TaxID=1389203 RepID=A0A9Q3DBP7_9BASI|nr:hypothetical protein [Austropuccinia psidii MF-1]
MIKHFLGIIDQLIFIPGKPFSHFLRGSLRNSPIISILNQLPNFSISPSKQPGHRIMIFTCHIWVFSGNLDEPTFSSFKELGGRKWKRGRFFSSSTGAGHRSKLLRSDYGGMSGLRDGDGLTAGIKAGLAVEELCEARQIEVGRVARVGLQSLYQDVSIQFNQEINQTHN